MKKIFIIVFLCIFAFVGKSYAGDIGWDFGFSNPNDNMRNEAHSLGYYGIGSSVSMQVTAYSWPGIIGDYWGYNMQLINTNNGSVAATLIDGRYNGEEYANSNGYSNKSITISNAEFNMIWIRTYYVQGWVGLYW
ncbi:hypothetical protein Palpr_2773 [Paludibacter propionicigenes WB4]|uniref:Uncharacterized protein n=1 Tax=Paludibacter propionicigenes (strain DSM 17365 / JCM 13257 / WB4) TaxID=694427 RepID=E4T858_PALPW|nr:hypothetical protein [Paludibacter propionicigenes]ADQ80902.1 hypothetical protein Palpr_2773 [Paludibacter propionicigenes WB4]